MLNEQEEARLLANVQSITDRLALMDAILAKHKMGINSEMVFRCGRSGLYFRGDYVREWGKSSGIGLGPDVCSEALNTDYDTPLPRLDGSIKRIEQIAFGVECPKSQVDAVLEDVDAITRENLWAVKAIDDPEITDRMKIIRPKQLRNPRGTALLAIQTEWARQKGMVNA